MEFSVLLISCFSLLPFVHLQFSLPNINLGNPLPGITNPLPDIKVENPLPDIKVENPLPDIKVENPLPDIKVKNPFPDIKFENYNPKELFEKLPGYGRSWMYFPDGNGIPIIAQLEFNDLIPKLYSPTGNYVTFHLYTRLNPNTSQIIELCNKSTITNSNLNFSRPTKFVTHGWTSNYKSDTTQTIKNNFLGADDYNVILVDWEKIASNVVYPISAIETKSVGDTVAEMIDNLVENGANLDSFHLIGHSLGAHIVGRAGHSVKSGKIERITGLDPALPGFEVIAPNENKLDKSDAKFVDVIHTCGGVLGYYSKLGHADFYPNGGIPSQPGCFGVPQLIEGCSHGRAWQYFAQSIKMKDGFIAVQCESWDDFKKGVCGNNTKMAMGESTPKSAKGVFYLRTKDTPFVASVLHDFMNMTYVGISKLIPLFG